MEQLDSFQTHRNLQLIIRPEILDMPLVRGDEKIALRAIAGGMTHGLVERAKERDGIERHANVDRRRKLRTHAPMLLPVDPLPCWLSRSSTTTFRQPACVRWYATLEPTIPPPMMTTSADRIYSM